MDLPTEAEVRGYLADSNWGRWGSDDQVGALNLITPAKRLEAAGLVRSGRAVSLARPFPVQPAANNVFPADYRLEIHEAHYAAVDYYGIWYHSAASTHLDALSHMWDAEGMWNGASPSLVTAEGAGWGSVDHWPTGITTRGVLLDVAGHRGTYVTQDVPVHGAELEAVARAQGVELRPGDALVVHCGREAYERAAGPWGAGAERPGLHASCLPFIRRADVAVLAWDMMDLMPSGYEVAPRGVHPVLYRYGVALVDNARLDGLAAACAEEGRYQFMLTLAPLIVEGGTGSPVNPIAIF